MRAIPIETRMAKELLRRSTPQEESKQAALFDAVESRPRIRVDLDSPLWAAGWGKKNSKHALGSLLVVHARVRHRMLRRYHGLRVPVARGEVMERWSLSDRLQHHRGPVHRLGRSEGVATSRGLGVFP